MKQHSCAGFTLLEMLIGMTLTGFILTLLFAAFHLGTSSWDAIEERAERSAQLQLARSFLIRTLSEAYPLRRRQTPDQELAFAGTEDTLRFVAPLPGQANMGGLRLIELKSTRSDADKMTLVFRHAAVRYEDKDFSGLGDEKGLVLIEGASSVTFSYFGTDRASVAPRWTDRWESTLQLPRLVRISVAFQDGRIWPDLLAEIRLGDSGCIWDDFYKRCVYL